MNTLKSLKVGEYFKLTETGKVYVRGKYVRELKKFSIYLFEDVNKERFIPGDREVITDFEF